MVVAELRQVFVLINVIFILVIGLVTYWLAGPGRQAHDYWTLNSASNTVFDLDLDHLEDSNETQNICNQTVRYKSWKQGVVSLLEPVVTRNCSLLFAGDTNEIKRVHTAVDKAGVLRIYREDFQDSLLNELRNCSRLRNEFSNIFYTSQEEVVFPLAYVLVVYNNPQQIMRFLKAIYRSRNIYCIHVDVKSSEFTKLFFHLLADCLPNVFIPQKVENVIWGHYSVLDAEMNCLGDLFHFQNIFPWKYALLVSGKELPLRTNREIVSMLKKLEGNTGMNVVGAQPEIKNEHRVVLDKKGILHFTRRRKVGPVPHKWTIYKSLVFFALAADFVEFVLHDPIAKDLRVYLQKAISPEERFYSTLYMMPGTPKGYNVSIADQVPTFVNVVWLNSNHGEGKLSEKEWRERCHSGVNVHDICVFGIEDMFQLNYKVNTSDLRGPIFHNKYFMEVDHVVMDCCEEELVRRNIEEFRRDYSKLCIVS